MSRFLLSEAGEVTTEFVVLCAAVVGLGFAAVMLAGGNADDRAADEFSSYLGPSPNGNGPVIAERPEDTSASTAPDPVEELVEEVVEEPLVVVDPFDVYDFATYEPSYLYDWNYAWQQTYASWHSELGLYEEVRYRYDTLVTSVEEGWGPEWDSYLADRLAAFLSEVDARGIERLDNHTDMVRLLAELGHIEIDQGTGAAGSTL